MDFGKMKHWPVEHRLNAFSTYLSSKLDSTLCNQNIGEGESNIDDRYICWKSVHQVFNSTELHFSKFTSFKIGTLVPSLNIADDFYGWPSIALDLMRPSFWGHLAMTINNIQTSRNWTRLTQSDQWCQQRQSNRVKRKNMDKTHQSCLFTKYQKGQLVKKEGSWRLPFSWGANDQFRIMKPPILFINGFIQGVANLQ